ncbi:MAG: AI-2E family transporter [Myxococcales bacterium]|nr:AI-2E family transporter [Myxococcales bacterium]
MEDIDLDSKSFWLRYRRYPFLLTKFVFFALVTIMVWTILRSIDAVLFPVLLSLLLAYLLDPAVDWFEDRGFSRTTGIGMFICLGALLLAAFTLVLYPTISHIVDRIVEEVPQLLMMLEDQWIPMLESALGTPIPHSLRELFTELGSGTEGQLPDLLAGAASSLADAWSQTGALAASLLNLVLIPILTFYFLRDFDIMKEEASHYLPVKYKAWLIDRLQQMDVVVGAWIRGQIEVAIILGGMYALGLGITFQLSGIGGVNGVAIGMIGGLLNIVPYFGFLIGFVMAMLLTILDGGGWGPIAGVVATFGIAQTLEGYVVTPRIVGEKVGLSPVVVIISLLLGAEVLGLLGVLLAIPLAGSLRVLLPDMIRVYKRSDYYLGELVWDTSDDATPDDPRRPDAEE